MSAEHREPTHQEFEAVGEEVRALIRAHCRAAMDLQQSRGADETARNVAAYDESRDALIIAIAQRILGAPEKRKRR